MITFCIFGLVFFIILLWFLMIFITPENEKEAKGGWGLPKNAPRRGRIGKN